MPGFVMDAQVIGVNQTGDTLVLNLLGTERASGKGRMISLVIQECDLGRRAKRILERWCSQAQPVVIEGDSADTGITLTSADGAISIEKS